MAAQRRTGFITYVAAAGEHEIVVFRFTSPEKAPEILQRVEILPEVKKGGMSTPMALAPDGSFLHVALRTVPLPLVSFAIDRQTGLLERAGVARLTATTPHINVDPTGRVLVNVGNPGATVSVTRIRNGLPRRHAEDIHHIGHKVHASVSSPDGKYLYVSCTDDKEIYQFRLHGRTGKLTPLKPASVALRDGGDPRHMVVARDGRHLYTVTEAGGRVVCFAIDPKSGGLTEKFDVALMPASFTADPEAADIHLTPDGRRLYATVRSADTIVGFTVNPRSGALTLVDRWKTESCPRSFAITPDSRALLVAGEKSGSLTAYAIDRKTGGLTKGFRMPIGERPNWIEFLG